MFIVCMGIGACDFVNVNLVITYITIRLFMLNQVTNTQLS
jgi:hypothetical protein